jgi:cellobiose transport system permease protein
MTSAVAAGERSRRQSRRADGYSRRIVGGPGCFTYVVLGLTVLASIFPLYWMLVIGSNDTAAINKVPPAIKPGGNFWRTAKLVWNNESAQFGKSLLNSVMVSAAVAVGVVFFSTLAGFAFAKLKFRGKGFLLGFVIATMMVPVQLGFVPSYLLMAQLEWVGKLRALVIPAMVSAFGVFWMRQFIHGAIPDELMDAARIDGCSSFRTYRSVVLPSIRGGAAVLGLFTFIQTWNDFFWPLIILNDPDRFTVQVSLLQLRNQYFVDYGLQFTGVVMATAPLLLLFVFTGRQIVGGVMEGAVKG